MKKEEGEEEEIREIKKAIVDMLKKAIDDIVSQTKMKIARRAFTGTKEL